MDRFGIVLSKFTQPTSGTNEATSQFVPPDFVRQVGGS